MFAVSVTFSPARFFTPSRLRLRPEITWLRLSRCRRSTSDTSDSPVDRFSSELQRYKDSQRYFIRRLKATYRRFSNVPDHSVVCGRHHVYFIEADGIYRINKTQNLKSEQVLNLGQVSGGDEESGLMTGARTLSSLWTVQRIRLSPQEKYLAATLTTNHREEPRCVVVKLDRRISPRVRVTLDNVLSFEWASDEVLFYTTVERLRCSRVFRLNLTSSGDGSTPVFEETRPDVFVEVALSRDQHLLSINCSSRTSSEVMLIDTTSPQSEPLLVQRRQLDLLYHAEHWRRRLILLTNTGPGQEYQVVQAPLSSPHMDSWVPVFTPGPDAVIKDMDVVGDHCVLTATTAANELVLIVVSLTDPEKVYTVQLPSWACAIKSKKPGLSDQHKVFEFLISSPVHPPASYCLHPEDGLLLSGSEDTSSPGSHGSYNTTRLEACSQDGALVPVTLFHTEAVDGLKQAPLLVHVYGAYGRDLNMNFSPKKRLLLEQGWALAYCHIRGGGERGLSWWRQARDDKKQRGVDDLRACLHHLFSSGVSSPALTALSACSAGAVPVGALCNTQPHMMRAVALQAPFLDVLGTMEDPSLPLTLEDREEWGDPVGNPQHRLIISSYCPLHNITPQRYPSMLLTTYSSDVRIPLSGVVKYTERLKNAVHTHFKLHPEPEPEPNIVLNIQPGANHLGPDDLELMLEEEALTLAFLHTELDLDRPRPRPQRKKKRW